MGSSGGPSGPFQFTSLPSMAINRLKPEFS